MQVGQANEVKIGEFWGCTANAVSDFSLCAIADYLHDLAAMHKNPGFYMQRVHDMLFGEGTAEILQMKVAEIDARLRLETKGYDA